MGSVVLNYLEVINVFGNLIAALDLLYRKKYTVIQMWKTIPDGS